jgi:DNA-binding response OmpR family regulator
MKGALAPPMTDPTRAGTIAIVEDAIVGRFLRLLLQRQGYRVIVSDAGEATDLLGASYCQVGLLITNRPEIFKQFGEQVAVLYLAAVPDPGLVRDFRRSRALAKPFVPEELLECVRELFAMAG